MNTRRLSHWMSPRSLPIWTWCTLVLTSGVSARAAGGASSAPGVLGWDLTSEREVLSLNNVAPSRIEHGVLCGMTAWDPYVSLRLPVEGFSASYCRLTLRLFSSEAADHIALYYRSPDGHWGLGQTLPVAKGWATYHIDATKARWTESGGGSGANQWGGPQRRIASFRIDPGNEADRWIILDYVRLEAGGEASFQAGVQVEPTTEGSVESVTVPPTVTAGQPINIGAQIISGAGFGQGLLAYAWVFQDRSVVGFTSAVVPASERVFRLNTRISTSLAAPSAALSVRIDIPGMALRNGGMRQASGSVRLENTRTGRVRPPLCRIRTVGGTPTMFVDDRPVAPFFVSTYDRDFSDSRLHREYAAGGLHLYSDWFGASHAASLGQIRPGVYDYGEFDSYFARILDADSQAFFLPHIGITPPSWWQQAHPEELCLYADGGRGPQSFASTLWKQETAEDLRRLIRHIETTPYADRILGYILYSGYSAEWQSWGLWDDHLADYSPPMLRAWRAWLTTRYGSEEGLRKAWSDPTVRLESAPLPTPAERHHAEWGVLRNPQREQKAIDFYQFLAQMTADAICHFCKVAKDASGRRSLVGTYYGYLTQHHFRQQDSSHLALVRVLRSPDVDFLMSPPLYTDRQAGGAGGFMSTTASVRLAGKLWISEADYRTHLSDPTAGYGRTDSLDTTLAVLSREMGNVLTQRTGVSWYDMDGGWLSSKAILDHLNRLRGIQQESVTHRTTHQPEVAVVVDEESFAYLRPMHPINMHLVLLQIATMPKAGLAWGYYLLSDIPKAALPPHRLYLFLNAVKMDRAMRDAVHRRLERERATAVWVYSAGFYDQNACGTDAVADLTGIRVRQKRWNKPLNLKNGTEVLAGCDDAVDPLFTVDDVSASPLGQIDGTPDVGLAKKAINGWTSVCCSAPHLRDNLIRQLARHAGCHVYLDTPDPVFVDGDFVCIHAASDGSKTLTLPRQADVIDALTDQVVASNTLRLSIPMRRDESRLFVLHSAGR